jgi:mannosyltransferase OCH1-like enzyme
MFDILNKKKTIKEFLMYNKPYPYLKNNYNSVIPLDIYQTWFTKDLPPKMRERVELLKAQNPRFNHHLFDDNDCREFIKTHFRPDVLEAYDTLIPGAYKADLWRLCVLFINGGIYMDIKFCCVNGFKLIELTEKEHFVKDRIPNTIYNALMACRKGNLFLYQSIRQIVANVKNKYYGETPLSPTGPKMLGAVMINNKQGINIDITHYDGGGYIIYKNVFIISTEYPEYNDERVLQNNKINKKRYDKMWEERNIYK